jgi:hypothetical protein
MTPKLRNFNEEQWDVARCLHEFYAALRNNKRDRLEAAMETAARLGCWRQAIAQFLTIPTPDPKLGSALLSFWNDYGLWRIGRELADDLTVFVDVLRRFLNPYAGPGMTLYRGEILKRHRIAQYGIAWTTDRKVAEGFAELRTLLDGGGVLLRCHVPSHAIISAPTAHSADWLREYEYIVDPRSLSNVDFLSD